MSGLLDYFGTLRPVTGSFSVRLEAASDCAGCVYSSGISATEDFRTSGNSCSAPPLPIKSARPLHRFSGGQVSIGGTPVEIFLVVFGAVLIPGASDESGIFQQGSERGVFVCWSTDIVGGGQAQRAILLPPDPSFNNVTKPLYCYSVPAYDAVSGGCYISLVRPGSAGTWSRTGGAPGCGNPMGTYVRPLVAPGLVGIGWTAVIS